ncbi:MAG: DNA polymerase III subunit alpha [Pseudomonadota bacterium]|nr:DNA polymerase III subunit alpha [Pseudomonadota bacterium]
MADPDFIHLRLHSEYSIVDGIVRIDSAIQRAVDDGMPALALTDLSNVFGMVKFFQSCRSAGIKPVVGADVRIFNPSQPVDPFHLTLLCQSRRGYLNLSKLLSRAYREPTDGRPLIHREWITSESTDDLIALSGAHAGEIGHHLLSGNIAESEKAANWWSTSFPGRFYIEVSRYGYPGERQYVEQAAWLAAQLQLPLVATHPVQFMDRDDFKAHEARVCIAEGYVLSDSRRPRRFTEAQFFRSQKEMAALFADLPGALANSVEIAKRCNFFIELGRPCLPQFPTPSGMSLDEYFLMRAKEGLSERLSMLFPHLEIPVDVQAQYDSRLAFESETIIQMGFSGYFLIVSDFIRWAKNNGVPVGPGRGSGAGSLVAYSLKITDLDPLRYDLLFERFLNPERVSMPDFDVDFCQDGRERVIDYVKQCYGIESVSQIATFGTMAAKAVIRDVGRVLDLPYNFVDQLAKLIPNELGMTLSKARGMEPLINARADEEEEVKELLILASKLEGLTRNVGMHAGGVLIAPGKITDFVPVYIATGAENVVSQFDKDDVEQVGLVKFDFLGLRTLTILDLAMRYAKRLDPTMNHTLETLPLDDKSSYDLLKSCKTTAVFQLESRGMKDLIRRLQPDCFEDIIALVALFRPGPLGSGMVDDFINRKHGKAKVDYFHPKLEDVLKSTYGIILYQEQVMLIAQILAGYSLGSADMLRRAMGKKKAEEMARHREIFIQGATERGVSQVIATNLFDLMEKFAEYGFNKSHSAAYAMVAYQTAWLKAHYPSAFMAATLSSDMDDTDKVRIFVDDCQQNGLTILPPDINLSDFRFVPVSFKEIRYGLGAIKGTGESAIDSIVKSRSIDGAFKDIFDFCKRVDRRLVNRRVLEALVRCGAFDSLHINRASLFASIGMAVDVAEQADRMSNQNSLFELFDESSMQIHSVISVPDWPAREKLINEKQSLGYYFSGHPFSAWHQEIAPLVPRRLAELVAGKEMILLAGVVSGIRTVMSKRGKMALVSLEDGTQAMEVVVFSDLFDRNRNFLQEDALLIVEGKANFDHYSGGLRINAERLFDLALAREQFAINLHLNIQGIADVSQIVSRFALHKGGKVQVVIHYENDKARCDLKLGKEWRLYPSDELVDSLASLVGRENIRFEYAYIPSKRNRQNTGTDG